MEYKERLVEIAITRKVREELKALKRELTYDQFFEKILELQIVRRMMK